MFKPHRNLDADSSDLYYTDKEKAKALYNIAESISLFTNALGRYLDYQEGQRDKDLVDSVEKENPQIDRLWKLTYDGKLIKQWSDYQINTVYNALIHHDIDIYSDLLSIIKIIIPFLPTPIEIIVKDILKLKNTN